MQVESQVQVPTAIKSGPTHAVCVGILVF